MLYCFFYFIIILGIFITYIIYCPFEIKYNVAYNRTHPNLVGSVLVGKVF